MNKLKMGIFLLLPIIVIFYLFVDNNSKRNIDTLEYITQLQQIKLLDSELDDLILSIGNTTYGNFDAISDLTKDLPLELQNIEQEAQTHQTLYKKATEELEQKIEVVHLVKRKAAIIRNSLSYLPTITKSIIDSKNSDATLLVLVVEALKDSSYLLQTGDANVKRHFESTLQKLKEYIDLSTTQESEMLLFYKHLLLVHDEGFLFKEYVRDAIAIPFSESVDAMIAETKKVYESRRAEARIYEYLSLFVVLFLGFISFLYLYKYEKNRERLLESAKYDVLTGVKSRFYLSRYALGEADSGDYLLLFDIKNFRGINDAYGYESGDKLLVLFSKLLSQHLSQEIFRVESDKFLVMQKQYDFGELQRVVEILEVETKQGLINFDFSVLVYKMQENIAFESILLDLEAGLNALKKTPNSKILEYDENLKSIASYKSLSKDALKNREKIEKALEEERFVPFFQPIANLHSDTIEKYEVLMRIEEDGKFLPPFEYILSAEKFNLINDITKQIVTKSFLYASGHKELEFSINLSTYDLESEEMLEFIKRESERYGIDRSTITFEVTETGMMNDFERSIQSLRELKNMGFMIAIDDFGVGHSSLQYLKDLPADIIKIDGSFIKNIVESKTDREFVGLINRIVKVFNKKSVAEFVESAEIVAILKELGIDYAQGYHIGKPAEHI